MRALLVYPTHKNCDDNAMELMADGIPAVCYPARNSAPTAFDGQNCWNNDADAAETLGFPVVKTVCTTCSDRERCRLQGYLHQTADAVDAEVALATHQRAATGGLTELVRDRSYVAIHENAVHILRPACRIALSEIRALQQVVNTLVTDPRWLDWFGSDEVPGEDGGKRHDPERKIQRQRQFEATMRLSAMLDDLEATVVCAERTRIWVPSEVMPVPQGLERILFRATREAGVHLVRNPWQFVLSAFAGELAAAAIFVRNYRRETSSGPAQATSKSVFGIRRNLVPTGRTVWFADATVNQARLSRLVGGFVIDATPDGTVPLRKKSVQYLKDVTIKTSGQVARTLLRGVLVRRNAKAAGVITHRSLVSAINRLEPQFRSRIAAMTYFHSGEDRSSNDWHHRCDLLVVLGTPRVPTQAVGEYLIQVGELEAACEEPPWGAVYWHGTTESGEDVRVEARGYNGDAWRSAHQDLVRATLVQAVGRGRGILEDGCDVVVFSTEECGLVVADGPVPWLNEQGVAIWGALRELTDTKSKRDYIGKVSVSPVEIAQRLGVHERTARRGLEDLESLGVARRLGPRSGWEVVAAALTPDTRTEVAS